MLMMAILFLIVYACISFWKFSKKGLHVLSVAVMPGERRQGKSLLYNVLVG